MKDVAVTHDMHTSPAAVARQIIHVRHFSHFVGQLLDQFGNDVT
jgi:hypothetical protein